MPTEYRNPDGSLIAPAHPSTLPPLPQYGNLAGAPIVTSRTSGNIVTASTAFAFVDTDSGGSAAARPMDLVVPNCKAGDWVELSMSFLVGNEAPGLLMNFAVIVAGARVRLVTADAFGLVQAQVSVSHQIIITYPYQVQSGDIENNAVRFRLQHNALGVRTINANTNTALRLTARGPFR